MAGIITVTLQEGFCNRMGQYAFARAYAEKYGCQLQTDFWMGQRVFEINDPPIKRVLPVRVIEHLETWDGETNINLVGWGQHQKHLIYSRADVRRWFSFRPEIIELLKNVPRHEICAHLRWGDFAFFRQAKFIAISKESYFHACDQFGIDRAKLHFISEENPIIVPGIDPKADSHTRLIETRETGLAFLPDFYALTQARILFRACSTFSWWAGVLGHAERIFSPDLRGIPYTGDRPTYQDVPFVEGNHMPLTARWEGHSELHMREI